MLHDVLRNVVIYTGSVLSLWGCGLILATQPWAQRHILYFHKAPIWLGQQLDKPESFGFLKNQITRLQIWTEDEEELFAWLITPLQLYARHESDLIKEDFTRTVDVRNRLAFRLLVEDPSARLIIFFHGNAGTIGQTLRTDTFKLLPAGASDRIHILAFDYRGFGHSTGTPTEAGLIRDAVAVVSWALETAQLGPEQILLVGNSLGTALTAAVADHFLRQEEPVNLAGIVLCAPFTDATTAVQRFSIGGFRPLLAPFYYFPKLQDWFARQMVDTWKTDDRIKSIVQRSKKLNLTMLHSTIDRIIPWRHTEELWEVAIAAEGRKREQHGISVHSEIKTMQLDDGGTVQSLKTEQTCISKVLLLHGGKQLFCRKA